MPTRMPTPQQMGSVLEKRFRVTWSDGHISHYAWRALRLGCPCAVCKGEWRTRRQVDPASIPEDVRATRVERVGNYALRFVWSDGHATGIYPFAYLRHELCECAECTARRAAAPP